MTTDINIKADSETLSQATAVFERIGLDLSTAINLFLKQSVIKKAVPFKVQPRKKTRKPGCMAGEIWMADDFDAPLEDFKEYM
jgi:DNA-damage-inducible protein J